MQSMMSRSFPCLRSVCLGFGGLLMLASISLAQKLPPDVGLVTKVSEGVTYWNDDFRKDPARAQAFMKFRRGDLFKVPEGALIQLLYFANGRQETWRGPVTFKSGEETGAALAEEKVQVQPEVQFLPVKGVNREVGAPIPFPRSAIRYSGGIPTMALSQDPIISSLDLSCLSEKDQREIQEAGRIYRRLKKQRTADDVGPELLLLGVLADHRHYQGMEKVVDLMLAKQPGNATLLELKAWVRSKSSKPARPARSPMKE